jgi:acyl-ACP thioesterase
MTGEGSEGGFASLVDPPAGGRRWVGQARVRLADVDRAGRVRLDAVARYLQDVANDDAIDAIGADAMNWVLRRTTLEVRRWAGFREDLTLTTWSSGVGSRWAERRTSIRGGEGAHLEAAGLWIHVDPATGRPRRLPDSFGAAYGEAHRGREVPARTSHGAVPAGCREQAWSGRTADIDLVGHVNNTVYWQMVEEVLPVGGATLPLRAELEYRGGLDAGQETVLRWCGPAPGGGALWIESGGTVAASARLQPKGYTG